MLNTNTIPLLYKHEIIYNSYIKLELWVDNFKLSPLCPLIVCKSTRTAIRSYKNKNINPHINFLKSTLKNKNNICAILCKSSWLIIDFDLKTIKIETKLSYNQLLYSYNWLSELSPIKINTHIKKLAIKTIYSPEILTLALLNEQTHTWIFETNSDTKLRPIKLRCMDINISIHLYSACIIFYSQHTLDIPKNIDNNIYNLYPLNCLQESYTEMINYILPLFNYPYTQHSDIYTSIDPITWSNGSRENQTLWPYIKYTGPHPPSLYNINIKSNPIYNYYSKIKPKNSIEFPINSNIYYYYNQNEPIPPYSPQNLQAFKITENSSYYPNIRVRTDDSPSAYIPTLVKRDNKTGPYLNYKFKNYISIQEYVLPTKPSNKIIISTKQDIAPKADLYILNNNNQVIKYYSKSNSTWTKTPPQIPLPDIITWPYYYKDIIHDYISTNRYKIIDSIHPLPEGIIDLNSKSTIKIPSFINLNNIYISATYYQTIRLLLFKSQQNVNTTYQNM